MSDTPRNILHGLSYYAWLAAAGWTIVVAVSLGWNLRQEARQAYDAARVAARAQFTKDVLYRRWNARHGGVYVPVTEHTQPNPHLAHVDARDVETLSGDKLTLVNPAFMTRQVHELALESQGVRGHITSLNPIRPANEADVWEAQALRAFEDGADEMSSVEVIDGEAHMRLMRPLVTEKGCLKCHARQGYREGDIRGGISVTTPMASYIAVANSRRGALVYGHGGLWLLGVLGVWLAAARIRRMGLVLAANEQRLAESLAFTQTLLSSLPTPVFIRDRDSRYVDCNHAFTELTGVSPEHIRGRTVDELWPSEFARTYREKDLALLRSGERQEYEFKVRDRHGDQRDVLCIKDVYRDRRGDPAGIIGAYVDITDRKRNELELRKLFQAVEQASTSVIITDADGRIEFVNPAFTATTGYQSDEVIGRNPRMLKSGLMPAETYRDMWRTLAAGEAWRGELQNVRKDGSLYWELATISPVKDASGNTAYFVAVKENITSRKAIEQELITAARTDKLTGLANRTVLGDRLNRAIRRARQHAGYHFAVLFLDFDRFKVINDSLGHETGDLLLKEIAGRLCEAVQCSGSLRLTDRENTVARFGGDEFVVLLDGIETAEDAAFTADCMLAGLSRTYRLGEHEIHSTASIGIVSSEDGAATADELLRDADTAMYEAKLAGKGRYVMFDESMRQRIRDRLELESDLRKAVDAGELSLVYQPIVCLQTAQPVGCEALLRWKHGDRGWISPAEFIPIAEDTGLILPIGEWVLREACAQFVRWREAFGDAVPPSVHVNLSRRQLTMPGFAAVLRRVLRETGMVPSRLHLEVTETAVMQDAAFAAAVLEEIGRTGVKLDMDDFGTGYSSLASLHELPVDVLKIDRSFIAAINRTRDFAAMIQAVAHLAHNLGIDVVAEGIETIDQAVVLQSLDCGYGQGYLFSKPLAAEDVPGFAVDRCALTTYSDVA